MNECQFKYNFYEGYGWLGHINGDLDLFGGWGGVGWGCCQEGLLYHLIFKFVSM